MQDQTGQFEWQMPVNCPVEEGDVAEFEAVKLWVKPSTPPPSPSGTLAPAASPTVSPAAGPDADMNMSRSPSPANVAHGPTLPGGPMPAPSPPPDVTFPDEGCIEHPAPLQSAPSSVLSLPRHRAADAHKAPHVQQAIDEFLARMYEKKVGNCCKRQCPISLHSVSSALITVAYKHCTGSPFHAGGML